MKRRRLTFCTNSPQHMASVRVGSRKAQSSTIVARKGQPAAAHGLQVGTYSSRPITLSTANSSAGSPRVACSPRPRDVKKHFLLFSL